MEAEADERGRAGGGWLDLKGNPSYAARVGKQGWQAGSVRGGGLEEDG